MKKSGSYIKGLDGLRAVAATLVFAFHTWGHWGYPQVAFALAGRQWDLTWLFHYGTEGVSVFFVLSGFLLSQPFWKAALGRGRPISVRDFFRRRFMRIYPAYLVALVIFALFYDNKDSIGLRATYFVTHVLLVHNLAELTVFRLSSPLWSVATEFQMYLVLPLLFAVIGLYLRQKGRAGIAAAVLFASAGLLALAFFRGAEAWVTVHPVDPNLVRAGGDVLPHLPIVGMAYFASGIAFGYVYEWVRNAERRGFILNPLVPELFALGFVFLLIWVVMPMPDMAGLSTVIWPRLALFYGALVAAIALGGRAIGLTRLLEWGPIRWVGMISYSFYLYHDFALHVVFHGLPDFSFGPLSAGLIKALVAYGATLVVSAISYYAIERRFHGAPRPAEAESRTATADKSPAAVPQRSRAESAE